MGSYILFDSSSGKKTLRYRNGRDIRIHSAHNPVEEAERSTAEFQKGRSTHVIVIGLGLGYHLRAIREKYPDTAVAAVEKDNEPADLAREHCPENLHGIKLIRSLSDLSHFFDEIDMTSFRGVSYYFHRPSYQIHKEFYDGIVRDAARLVSSKVSDLLTRFEFEERWIKNILGNIPRVFTSPAVKSLFGRFRGYPGIIVSAGPSLKKNARLLNKLRDRAVIVCVDTAALALRRFNVRPHITMTLDAQKHSLKHFLGLRGSDPLLLCDVVSLPDIARSWTGKIMLSTTSKYYTDSSGALKRETTPLMDWIEKFIPEIGDIQSGGSVATSAFDLLLNMGCDPIILTGQDLAYTGREIHCTGTHHNDEWLPKTTRFLNLDSINQNVIRKRKIKYVESYGGKGKVISDFVFDLYRGWFEDSAKKVSVAVVNATEGGALIRNTVEKPLSALCRELKPVRSEPDEILEKILSQKAPESSEKLLAAAEKAMEEIRSLEKSAKSCLEKNDFSEDVLDRLESDDIAPILNPFLRKTKAYASRLAGREETLAAVYRDIAAACGKILPLLQRCVENLHKFTRPEYR